MNSGALPASLPPESFFPGIDPRGARAAQDFEAYLIGTLLQSMEKTFATIPGQEASPGEDDYNYLGTQALAEGIARQGGVGIATILCQHLPGHEGKGDQVSIGGVEEAALPKVPPTAADGSR